MSDIEQDAIINDEARYITYRTNSKTDFLLTIALEDKQKYMAVFDAINEGARIGLVAVLIGDDEKPVKPKYPDNSALDAMGNSPDGRHQRSIDNEKPDAWDKQLDEIRDVEVKKKHSTISNKAYFLEQSDVFKDFIEENWPLYFPQKPTPKEFIYGRCEIESKAELDTNEVAAKRYMYLKDSVDTWVAYKGLC